MGNSPKRKSILIVDDPDNVDMLVRDFNSDLPDVMIRRASALDLAMGIMASWPIDCLVIEAFLPYGENASVLNPETDPGMCEGSLRLIRRIRELERDNHTADDDCLWIFLLTTQDCIAQDEEIQRLLGDRGSIHLKPFDTIEFSFTVADALGVRCALHPDLRIGILQSFP